MRCYGRCYRNEKRPTDGFSRSGDNFHHLTRKNVSEAVFDGSGERMGEMQKTYTGKPVVIFNRMGNEYLCDSIAQAAQALNVNRATLRRRIGDGNWIHTDTGVAVRVRFGR